MWQFPKSYKFQSMTDTTDCVDHWFRQSDYTKQIRKVVQNSNRQTESGLGLLIKNFKWIKSRSCWLIILLPDDLHTARSHKYQSMHQFKVPLKIFIVLASRYCNILLCKGLYFGRPTERSLVWADINPNACWSKNDLILSIYLNQI